MKHLYFIGNGFDMHHGFDTGYDKFRIWLKKYDEEAYNNLIELYGVNDDESDGTRKWWSVFESHLVDFDVYEDIVEIAFENRVDYGADDFREGDRYTGGVVAEQKFENTMEKILGYFDTWVDSLGDLKSGIVVKLDKTADFINFNYTLTLENMYGIPEERVHHIHGKLGKGNYILGHGKSYSDIEKSIRSNEEQPPEGLSEEEKAEWYADQWDEAYENTVAYTASKLASYKKDTAKIINANISLFDSMSDLEEITIYGSSFSQIDTPYFSEAIRRAKNKNRLKFVVNWHSQKDLDSIEEFFKAEGIDIEKVELMRLEDITTIL